MESSEVAQVFLGLPTRAFNKWGQPVTKKQRTQAQPQDNPYAQQIRANIAQTDEQLALYRRHLAAIEQAGRVVVDRMNRAREGVPAAATAEAWLDRARVCAELDGVANQIRRLYAVLSDNIAQLERSRKLLEDSLPRRASII